MIELIDECERIPKEVTHFELEFVMILFSETFADFRNLVFCSINVIVI